MDVVLAAVVAALAGAALARLAVVPGWRRRLAAEVARHRQTTDVLRQVEADSRILEHDLARERQAAAEKLVLLEGAHERLKVEFKALSADALRESTSQFLTLAEERLAVVQTRGVGDLEERRQAVEHLVAPLGDALTKMEDRLDTIERARQNAYPT